MSPREHHIELDADDVRCLERGGSISVEVKPGTRIVWLAMKSDDNGPRFRPPINANVDHPKP